MKKDFVEFVKEKSAVFFKAVANLFIFLPYFFSVPELLATLVKPWKNLSSRKTTAGFSFEEWFGRFSFNIISSGIGLVLRLFLIMVFLMSEFSFILFIPFAAVFYFLTLPFSYFFSSFKQSNQQKYNQLREEFVTKHLLKEENRSEVEKWFDIYYQTSIKKSSWWELSNLFSTPPLARDWSAGYTPTLDQYSDELTLAKPHYIHLVDREKEIAQIEQLLAKSKEANVIIVGEEGVGKHTIVEALAKRIYEGRINPLLAYKRIIKIDLEKILSQSIDQSQKEQTLKNLFNEATQARNIIILIDDFHKFISPSLGLTDISTIISQFASSKDLQFIGITNPHEFQKYIFINDHINRLFEKVEVSEIVQSEALNILLTSSAEFEARYNLTIPYETIKEVVEKSDFYITDIPFPEKAIVLLDRACVYGVEVSKNDKNKVLTPYLIDNVLSQKTHIPVNLTQAMKDKLLNLEKFLFEAIVYQREGLEKISSALRKSFVVAGKRKKPLASFLLLGPTGVGKTETAKALAEIFFQSSDNMIRFDMSLYQTQNNIADLVGSQEKGTVGLLTSALRQKPYGVLLLDEIEKANRDLINIFLTVIDEGYFTDGEGKRVDCKNLIIIATSNAGSQFIYKILESSADQNLKIDQELINFLVSERYFTPEFLNRFDGVVVYKPLPREAIIQVAKKMLDKISADLNALYHIKFTITADFLKRLAQKGYSPQYGARNMERVIRDEVEDKIAKMVLNKEIKEGETLTF